MQEELTQAIHQYLTTAPASRFAQQPVEMLDHWQGSDNLLWRVSSRGTEAVIKLFLDAGQARNRRQFDAHTLFAEQGLAPAPLWYDQRPEGVARPVNVYTWVEGTPLTAEANALAALAHAVAAIHSMDGREVARFSPHPYTLAFFWRIEQASIASVKQWLDQAALPAVASLYEQLTAAATQVVEQALPLWASAAAVPVHGDLQLEHAWITPQGICLVDWEQSGLGDPALEIARFLHHSRTLVTGDRLATWVDTYLATVQIAGLEQRIAAYNCLLPLHAMTYLLLGLHQYITPDSDLVDMLPFFNETLAASLAVSAASLSVELNHAPSELAGQVVSALAR